MHPLETKFLETTSRVVKQICDRLGFTCDVDGYDVEYNGTMATFATFLADYSANFTPGNTFYVFDAGQDVATFLLGITATFNPISFLVTSKFGTISIWRLIECLSNDFFIKHAPEYTRYIASGGKYKADYYFYIFRKQ